MSLLPFVFLTVNVAGFDFHPFLFLIGLVTGTINTMAGGGSALTLPILIFLGLDGAEANGTNRLGILLQNISASSSFLRGGAGDVSASFRYSLFTLPGAVCGAFAAVVIDDLLFKKIVAVVVIAVAASMFFPLSKTDGRGAASGRKWLVYPGLAAVGFYGGFIQVGVGLAIMALLFHTIGRGFASVNSHKVFIVMIFTVPALGVFFLSGDVDIAKGLSLGAGTALGGWWAAKLSLKKASAARYFIAFAIVLCALKLLGVL